MDVWSWPEMTKLVYDSCLDGFRSNLMHMRPSSIRGLNKELVSNIYRTWGPSARLCVELNSVEGHRPKVRQALEAFQGRIADVLRSMSISGDAGASSVSAPHSVFYIRPTKPLTAGETWITGIKIYVPTDALRQECFRAVLLAETKSQQEFFDVLSTNPLSRSTSGYILEKWMHLHLSGSISSGSSSDAHPQVNSFNSEGEQPVFSFPQPRRFPTTFDPKFEESSLRQLGEPPYYLQPRRMNQATFDGVVLTTTQVIVLQATVSKKHPIKRKGILELLKLLPSYRKFEWVFVYYVHQKDIGSALSKVGPLKFKDLGTLGRYYALCPLIPVQMSEIALVCYLYFATRLCANGMTDQHWIYY